MAGQGLRATGRTPAGSWTVRWTVIVAIGIAGGLACSEPTSSEPTPASGCTHDGECPAATAPCKRSQCGSDGVCGEVDATGGFCEDGDPCTVSDHCESGACKAGPNFCGCKVSADCAPLEDGDACNGTLLCDATSFPPRCAIDPNTVVHCKKTASGPCAVDACDPKTGQCAVVPRPDATPCDDDEPCTVDERCKAGVCAGGTDLCACGPDKPCPDDGDACNGQTYCDMSTPPWVCRAKPGSVVNCSSVKDTACLANLCDPKTGKCGMTPAEDGKVCEDGNPCTENDSCQSGLCKAGSEAVCKCKSTADCASQDDGDQCNGTLFCNAKTSLCELNPATVVSCPTVDDTPCLKNACYPKTGLCQATPIEKLATDCSDQGCVFKLKAPDAPVAAPIPCDDGNACTKGEVCQGGQCASGSVVCFCTVDADCKSQDDGDLCNGTLFCNKQNGKCELNPASVVKCPTVGDTACLRNVCEKTSGQCKMTAVDDNKLCDDDNACTTGDLCQSGKCKPGTNTCDCWLDADCAAKEDGDACNGTLYCDKTGAKPKCVLNPASVVVCNKQPASPCLTSVCNPVDGKCVDAPTSEGGQCDDNSACTAADACKLGACLGKPVTCDDANPCTTDACQSALGCVHKAENCADGNDCTVDLCDKQTGKCAFASEPKDGASCNADDNGCTLNDHCKAGTCVAGAGAVCSGPAGTCEQWVCNSTGAQSHKCQLGAKADGTACEDSDPCTVGSSCKQGSCSGATKQRYFLKAQQPPLEQGELHAIASLADGGLVFGGAAWQGDAAKPQASAWWLVRADGAGDALWQDKLPAVVASAAHGLRVLHLGANGSIYGGGAVVAQGGGLDALLVRWGDKPGPQWSKQLGTASADEAALAMVVDPLGASVLAGWRSAGDKRQGWAVELGANEQQVWSWQDSGGGDGQIEAIVRQGDGTLILAGHRLGGDSKRHAWLVNLGVQGKLIWQAEPAGADQRANAALLTNGRLVLAGAREVGGVDLPWLAAVAPTAPQSLLWAHNPVSKGRVRALISVEMGRMVQAGGIQPLGGKPAAWVAGLDALGNTRWSRALEHADAALAHAIAPTDDGGVVVAGRTEVNGKVQGLVARLDAWGHGSCTEAGKCLGLKAGACSDSDPCTVELCDGAQGCKVAPVEKLLCDPADGCSGISACVLGKCPATAHGRLYSHTWSLGNAASLARVVPTADGGYAFAGQAPLNGAHSAAVGRVGPDGALLWSDVYQPSKAWGMALAVQPTSDGGLLVAGQGDRPFLRRYKADGTPVWTHDWPLMQYHSLHDLARYPDGSFALVLQVAGSSDRYPRVWKINEAATVLWKGAPFAIANLNSTEVYPVAPPPPKTSTGQPLWGLRAVTHPDGEVSVVGGILPKGGANITTQPWIGRNSASGAFVWEQEYGSMKDGLDDMLYDGAATSDGGVLAVGARTPVANNTAQGYLLRVDKAGKKLWHQFANVGGAFAWGGVATLPDGGFAVVGQAWLLGTSKHYAVGIDALGTARWSRTWSSAGRLSSVSVLASGDLLIGGPAQGANPKALVMRTDAWGHAGCAVSGACAKLAPDSCDDANPCTADACEAAKGCVHTALGGCNQ